jgi:hypothetical protein
VRIDRPKRWGAVRRLGRRRHRPDGVQRTFTSGDPLEALQGLLALVEDGHRPGSTPAPTLDRAERDRRWAEAEERGRKEPTDGTTLYVPSPRPRR